MLFLGGSAHLQKIDVPDDAEYFAFIGAGGPEEYQRIDFYQPTISVMVPLELEYWQATILFHEWLLEQARTYLNKI